MKLPDLWSWMGRSSLRPAQREAGAAPRVPSEPARTIGSAALSSDRWIDPLTLMQLAPLELRARRVVEGFFAGLNRSPYHGFSIEFSEYRPYTSGEDLRHLDWKLYARTDRYYLKRFEDETNLRCLLALDASRSMEYGSIGYSKFDYARTVVATLAYFLNGQRDATGLAIFSDQIHELMLPRYRPGHLRRLLVELEREPAGSNTNFERSLSALSERIVRRGLVVLVSDWLAPLEALESALGVFTARGQEVLLLQVLDPAERTLELPPSTMLLDLETGRRLEVDADQQRERYQAKLTAHQQALLSMCERNGVLFRSLQTDEPLEVVLPDLLRLRQRHTVIGPRRRGTFA